MLVALVGPDGVDLVEEQGRLVALDRPEGHGLARPRPQLRPRAQQLEDLEQARLAGLLLRAADAEVRRLGRRLDRVRVQDPQRDAVELLRGQHDEALDERTHVFEQLGRSDRAVRLARLWPNLYPLGAVHRDLPSILGGVCAPPTDLAVADSSTNRSNASLSTRARGHSRLRATASSLRLRSGEIRHPTWEVMGSKLIV